MPKPNSAVAQAGFEAYYSRRPGWAWDSAQFVTAERWRIVATQILYGQIVTPRALRAAYTADMVRSPWRGLSSPHGQTWSRVHGAMLRELEETSQRLRSMIGEGRSWSKY